MDKNQANRNISELVKKYQSVTKSSIKKYSEEDTKQSFILPLFTYLGWDFSNRSEITAEENQSSGRVDYGFYLNGRAKFFLETKSLKTNLNKEEYAHQAIRYSWNKGVTWVVLTDFESIKIFNADTASKYLGDKLFFEIQYTEYLERFDQLWLLSKESFLRDEIDKAAERSGKKLQKVSVTNLLYKDLNECRKILTNSLSICNDKIPKDLIDEGVQKILDRLIFLRVAEDRKIEPPILKPLIRESLAFAAKKKIPLYSAMVKKFRELDKIYNSNLFSLHPFERWEEYGGATEKVVDILYGKKGYFEYDFKVIPADILGTVYENYLGYVAKTATAKKGDKLSFSGFSNTIDLEKEKGKRKEQGIYYTPSFIVDFIARNALKPVLDNCKSINDLKKIRVLDPACGSGSFLIKALEVILEKYKEFNYKESEYLKIQIITENLYGVDLDEQAVEIAQLNLLLNTLEQRGKLPPLDHNIKNGNSLISGTDKELKKYFGKNFKDKKPFNWQEEFSEVFKQGGFDAIIGNPPYINAIELTKTIGEEVKKYWKDYFYSARGTYDIYILFFEQSLNLCKKGGFVSFITPNKYLSSPYGTALRKLITENYRLIKVSDLSKVKVFDNPSVYPVITLIQKDKLGKYYHFSTEKIFSENTNDKKDFKVYSKTLGIIPDNIWAIILSNNIEIVEKIFQSSEPLYKIAEVQATSTASEAEAFSKYINENRTGLRIINSGTIDRYKTTFGINAFMNKGKHIKEPFLDISRISEGRRKLYTSPKIILSKLALRTEGFLDKNGVFASINTNCIHHPIKDYSLELLAGIINSTLFNYIYSEIFSGLKMGGGYFQFQAPQLRIMPIINLQGFKSDEINTLVDKIVELNGKTQKIPENSNKWNLLKTEIEKLDKKIDNEVYKLYGLTPEEIKIVEGETN